MRYKRQAWAAMAVIGLFACGCADDASTLPPSTTPTGNTSQPGNEPSVADLPPVTESALALQDEVQQFLDNYTKQYLELNTVDSEAQWVMNTRIKEGDNTAAEDAKAAAQALAEFSGSVEVIDKSREYLNQKAQLKPLQTKQLERILYMAANKPQTIPDVVRDRIAAETEQTEKLYGFKYMLDGEEVSTGDIDEILNMETELPKRLAAWEVSKEVGPQLKDGLANLRDLRNQTVQALDYPDYFAYQVSDYGMTVDEMRAMMKQFNKDLRPLYRELHTYVRYELADRYNEEVPDMIPAHWLPNRWGQNWQGSFKVEGVDLDEALKEKPSEWLVEQAERFYVSLGFENLPRSFYDKSSLYPLPEGAEFKKNNHASAWHMDLDRDVRCLMSVVPTTDYYNTTHHELGHIYYYLAYSTPEVPPLLREGANRAFHEAIGSQMGMAAMQPKFVQASGLKVNGKADPMQAMLYEALDFVVFIPFSAGVMTEFEHKLYSENLPKDQWNKTWWDLAAKYQGIAPPSERGEEFCDAATKTHINDDAAQYYDYAMSFVLLMQMHDHVARNILKEDPHDTNYFGRTEVGDFLKGVLAPGATADWRELVQESTGSEITAQTMVTYFEPLMEWLQQENEGRTHTLPELE